MILNAKMKAINPIKSVSLVLLLSSLCQAATAQIQQAWVAKYDNGLTNGNHQALKMTLDNAGNIYVLGVSQNASGNTGYVTIKYAPNGSQLWAARYDATNYPSAAPTGFAMDSQSNVVVTGNAVTVKYDANGNQLWTAPYNALAIAVDSRNNVCLTGVSNNFTTMKLNPTGSNIWSATWIYYGLPNLSKVIAIDSSNDVYVAGREAYPVPRSASEVYLAIIKYDPNGNQLWETNPPDGVNALEVQVDGFAVDNSANVYLVADYVSAEDERYYTSKYHSDGSFVWGSLNLTGSSLSEAHDLAIDNTGDAIVTGADAYNYPNVGYGTYKLDTNGNYLWGGLSPATMTGNSAATSLAVDSGNNIYVTGYSTITNTGHDVVTLKYDSKGNQVWLQRYDGPAHGNDAGNAIAVDTNGNVYVAGYETESNGRFAMILIKYSPFTLQRQTNGNILLQAYGWPGENFDFQASTDLQTWLNLATNAADTNGFVQFIDTNAPIFNHRFYRTEPQ